MINNGNDNELAEEGKGIELSYYDNEIEHSNVEGKLKYEHPIPLENEPLQPLQTNDNIIMLEDEDINYDVIRQINEKKQMQQMNYKNMLENGDAIMNSIENDIVEHMSTSQDFDNKQNDLNDDLNDDNNNNYDNQIELSQNNQEFDDESIEISYNNGDNPDIPRSIIKDFKRASMASITSQ